MEVLNYYFNVDKFEVKNTLEGNISIYPNYGYTLLPPTVKTPCIFKMTLHYEIVADTSGKIIFDTNSEVEIDNQKKTPTVDFLYQLVLSTCRDSTIEFGKEILQKTKIPPFIIPPPKIEKCEEELQNIITRAFPNN